MCIECRNATEFPRPSTTKLFHLKQAAYPPQQRAEPNSLELAMQGGPKSLPLDPSIHARHTANGSDAKRPDCPCFDLSCIADRPEVCLLRSDRTKDLDMLV